jgi:hypothetical protein
LIFNASQSYPFYTATLVYIAADMTRFGALLFLAFTSVVLQAFFANAACPIPGSYFDGLNLQQTKTACTTVSFETKAQCDACLAATVGALDAQVVKYLDLSQLLAQLSGGGSSAALGNFLKGCSGTYNKALKKQIGAAAAKKGKKVSKCFTSAGFPSSEYPKLSGAVNGFIGKLLG